MYVCMYDMFGILRVLHVHSCSVSVPSCMAVLIHMHVHNSFSHVLLANVLRYGECLYNILYSIYAMLNCRFPNP